MAQIVHIPAPMGGVNTADPFEVSEQGDCVEIENLIPGFGGLQHRHGLKTWASTPAGKDIRTIIPFHGAVTADDRLFVATTSGIHNLTTEGASAVAATLAYGTTTGNAGFGVSCTMVTSAGHFVLHCDEVNGYHVYTASTATWAAVTMGAGGTQINGIDPATFAFVMLWKNRVWFVQRDTATAWYLPVGQLYGTVTRFDFGNKFSRGGDLRGLWSWTLDAGAGMDDRLVAVSGGGDVLVYEGTDPSSSSAFQLTGAYNVSGVPVGRRLATDVGGDLMLLTTQGILPASMLKNGQYGNPRAFLTRKIQRHIQESMASGADVLGWALGINPQDNALVLNVPSPASAYWQMSLATGAWSRVRMETNFLSFMTAPLMSAVWRGLMYIGGDGDYLARTWRSSHDYGSVANAFTARIHMQPKTFGAVSQKQVMGIRPRFITASTSFTVTGFVGVDYDMARVSNWHLATLANASPFTCTYSLATGEEGTAWAGVAGMGTRVALLLSTSCATDTAFGWTLAGFDVMFREGVGP